MSYVDLSDHPGTTLNLIERMSIVPLLEGSAAVAEDPKTGTYFAESAFLIQMEQGILHDISFNLLAQFPVEDGGVVSLRCVAGIAPDRHIQMRYLRFVFGVGDFYLRLDSPVGSSNPLAPLFTNVLTDCVEVSDNSYTFTKEDWEALIAFNTIQNPEDEDDVIRFQIEGDSRPLDCQDPDTGGDGHDTLSRTWCYFQVSYPYSIVVEVPEDGVPGMILRSHSRVLTSKVREPVGEFHYHYANWVIDPDTGSLLVESRCGHKKTLIGAGVSPGGDGRPDEGNIEFRGNGELFGSVARFATHSACIPV